LSYAFYLFYFIQQNDTIIVFVPNSEGDSTDFIQVIRDGEGGLKRIWDNDSTFLFGRLPLKLHVVA